MTKILNIEKSEIVFSGLIATIFLSIGFYMYFINATVHNVVATQNLEMQAGELALEIGNLEFQYVSKKNSITLAYAHELGFKDSSLKQYAVKGDGNAFAFLR